jgi:hypothetical protein
MRSNLRRWPGEKRGAGRLVSTTVAGCDVAGPTTCSVDVETGGPVQETANSTTTTSRATRLKRRRWEGRMVYSRKCPREALCGNSAFLSYLGTRLRGRTAVQLCVLGITGEHTWQVSNLPQLTTSRKGAGCSKDMVARSWHRYFKIEEVAVLRTTGVGRVSAPGALDLPGSPDCHVRSDSLSEKATERKQPAQKA